MTVLKRGIPVSIAILIGLIALGGLLLSAPVLDLLLNWAGFLAAAALVLGILNLLSVHVRRVIEGNVYSLILVLSMLVVFTLAITDAAGQTQGGVDAIFSIVQTPLESALASLLAFFLLFAGVRMMRVRRTSLALIFLASALFFLLTQAPLPQALSSPLLPIREWLDVILVVSGTRGLMLGIALGVIVLSVRLLIGLERPYSS